MTILFEDRILGFQWKDEVLAATELSSRPERSVVERSAVSFLGSHADSNESPRSFPLEVRHEDRTFKRNWLFSSIQPSTFRQRNYVRYFRGTARKTHLASNFSRTLRTSPLSGCRARKSCNTSDAFPGCPDDL